tara:strand:+ start:3595 stop:5295 length:1701 start_codon:yes stop_codon:yes gene_type:complete
MINIHQFYKLTNHLVIVIIFITFSTLHAKNLDKFEKAESISDYFSGIVSLNQSKYEDSYKYLKKLDGLEKSHSTYSSKYLYSLVNSGNLKQAFNFSKKLELQQKGSFVSDLIIGIYYLKNSKLNLSKDYFLKAKKRNNRSFLDIYIAESLYNWSSLEDIDLEKAKLNLNEFGSRFENLKKIQNAFLNCYFSNKKTEKLYNDLTLHKEIDFSRYNYFYAKYLESVGKIDNAKSVITNALSSYPRNLLLNQYKNDLNNSENSFNFNCQKINHVTAEILYITANALSSQSLNSLSNFYLNLSKYLNPDFHPFDTLMAENLYKIDDLPGAKKIYKNLKKIGTSFKWFADKQISRILLQENKKEKSIKFMKKSYQELANKGIYEIFDYAEFLKNNEKFEESIEYYTEVLKSIDAEHPLYPEVTDGRGVSYERIGEWDKAEKDLLSSLNVSPDQAYVINYLAYSWIEQGVKIKKSLQMLEKANKLKSNDPYIIDSLGWALFKLDRFKEAKEYLQIAVRLMPADPIVNDHYGDVLWKIGSKIQARYYWNYVLNLEKVEDDLREKVSLKLTTGL